jgi:uncharacterized protein
MKFIVFFWQTNSHNLKLMTKLLEAIQANKLDEIKTLLSKIDISQQELSNALLSAVYRNNVQAVEILLQTNADVNHVFNLGTALTEAVDEGNIEIVRMLLCAGANTSIPLYGEVSPPLMIAAGKGDFKMVKLLIEAGADVNQIEPRSGDFAMASAAARGYEDIFNYLAPLTNSELREKAKEILPLGIHTREREKNTNPLVKELSDFIFEGNLEGVKEIIVRGGDVNGFDEIGGTPLCLATTKNNLEIVRLLLEAGANPNLADDCGRLPLDSGSSDITALLIEAGADVDTQNIDGRTDLMVTAGGWGRLQKMKVLLEAGANINVRDKNGKTALMYAVKERSNEEKITLLIEAGADLDIQDNDGNTALSLAKETGHTEIVQLLIDAGANED